MLTVSEASIYLCVPSVSVGGRNQGTTMQVWWVDMGTLGAAGSSPLPPLSLPAPKWCLLGTQV